jgi:hypothetical protein
MMSALGSKAEVPLKPKDIVFGPIADIDILCCPSRFLQREAELWLAGLLLLRQMQ